MELEESIDSKPISSLKNFANKIAHYGKFTLESILNVSIQSFGIPLGINLRGQHKERELNFTERVIQNSAVWTVLPMIAVTAIAYLPFGVPFFTSNILFRGGSFIKNLRKHKTEELEAAGQYSKKSKTSNYLKNLPARFKSSLKKLPKKLAIHACTYALVSSLAIGHYTLTQKNKQEYKSKDVGVNVQKFILENENKKYQFYLLGEEHIYNYSSSFYVGKLIEEVDPNFLLTEGINRTEYKKARLWKKYSERAMALAYDIIALGSDRAYAEPSEICKNKGIPIKCLEQVSELNKGRGGLSNTAYGVIGVAGTTILATAPAAYFGAVPLRYFDIPYLKGAEKIILPGAIHNRDKLMVKSAILDINQDPNSTYLIRGGKAHCQGMINEFSKYGKLTKLPFEFEPK